ncbi:unnamed protein product [Phyllotreta striolata]|uniref:Uncharacterized protein n=1 Tax=Phyllotreta striolata TaxID=444603 RepID=A0A9N9TZM7_PHYSR|nr:unnamed protein product [Phyllotreta striolata]
MKLIIFLCLTIVALVQAEGEEEREKLNEQVKKCEEELGGPKNLLEKLEKGEDIGDATKAGKMALCFNVKMGHMDADGDVVEPEFVEHVERLTSNVALRGKIVDECGKKNGETPEIAALNFVRCMLRLVP